MTNIEIIGRAEELFNEGYACSEAVLLAVGEATDPEFDRGLVRLATPWAGGIAYGGSVCGSLAGALMLIGLRYGRESADGSPKPAWAAARKLRRGFEERIGSLLCGDITGGKFHKAGDRCRETVRVAAELALELLDEPESERR